MRVIELLKVRFGEQSLQYCDIMIKDIASSKRMNKLVHDEKNEISEYQALIISHLFWPSFRADSLKLPPEIQGGFDAYHKGFRNIKRDRKLQWLPFLGAVDLELEINGELKELTVNPLQATIIYYFQDQDEWNINDLGELMDVPSDILKRKIVFWVGQGVLQQISSDVYRLREEGDECGNEEILLEEEGNESSLTSADDERAEMWALCFNFINACLANHGSMGVDKIHFMLSSLMGDGYKATQAELRTFLEQKVKQDLLEKSDNLYSSKE